MKAFSVLGRLLMLAGGAGAWLAAAGSLLPQLDPLASFMPIFGIVALLGAATAWRGGLRTAVMAVAALAPTCLTMAPELIAAVPAAPAAAPAVRIVTHNVWVKNSDPALTAQVIVDASPDVVILQEVDGTFRPMLEALRQRLPYATDCPPECDFAILSRWPMAGRDYFLKDAAGRPFGPPLPWAEIRPPNMPAFRVVTTHYPQPIPARTHGLARAEIAEALGRVDRTNLVLAGDMNLTPWTAAMRAQDKELAPLTRFTRNLPSWRRPLPVMPIDHLYAGPGWGLVEARRLSGTGSDHYPLLVTLGRR